MMWLVVSGLFGEEKLMPGSCWCPAGRNARVRYLASCTALRPDPFFESPQRTAPPAAYKPQRIPDAGEAKADLTNGAVCED